MDGTLTTQLQRVSEWIEGLRYDDIPSGVVQLAQWELLDAVAAICAGSRSTVGVKLRRALARSGSGGSCTVLATSERWNWENAVYYHAAMINALEMDHFTFMGHIGQSAISAPLSLSERLNTSGKDFIVAMVAAQEVGGRMGGYLTAGPQQGHMRAYIHRVAAVVATCKLYSCDPKTIATAMAIALSAPEFPLYPASFSPDTKVTCTSAPTIEGVRSGFLAMEGLDAPLDIVEHPIGFISCFSYLRDVPDLWAKIGESWTFHTLSVKNYATCAYAQGPVNAGLELRNEFARYDPDAVDRITIFCPLSSVIMEKFSQPHFGADLTPVNTHFSNRRSLATSLLHGAPTGEFYREGNFERKTKSIREFAEKIHLQHDWQLTLNLIKSIDRGLQYAGRPGVLSFGANGSALDHFKKAFDSRPLLHWQDIPDLYRLSNPDRIYLFKRFWRSWRAKLPFLNSSKRLAYRSTEGDLKQMAFAIGGRVEIQMKNSKKLEASCTVPSGFAGDPNRLQVAEAKFFRETIPVWGQEKATQVKNLIFQLDKLSIRALLGVCAK